MADLSGNIPLFCAIESGNSNVVRKLLAVNAEKQVALVKEPVRDSPMHLAVRKRDSDMCKTLVESGAGVDGQNEEGAGDIGQVARVMYIRVPNPDGGFFFFDTATQQLYEGDGEPPADQILEEPTLDSPLRLPPREGGF